MNVSQYSPSRLLERKAIGSIESLPSVKKLLESESERAGSLGPKAREAVRSGTCETDDAVLSYSIDDEGDCTICRCEAKAVSVRVPALIDDCPVVAIGGHAFSTCYNLERIELPPSVRHVCEHAFMNTALARFDAPPGLLSIGAKAFFRCERLSAVSLDEELRFIGSGAFRESPISYLSIPALVSFIGRDAFKSTRLGFAGKEPTLCIAEENRWYGLMDGSLYRLADGALELVQALDEEIVEYRSPVGLVWVGERAFADKRKLCRVELAEGVLAVGESAFKGCKSLVAVSLPDSVRYIGRRAFSGTELASLRIPRDLQDVGPEAFYTGGSVARDFHPTIGSVEISPGNDRFYVEEDTLCRKTSEGAIALLHFGRSSHVVVPRSVTAIGPYAFMNSRQATHVTMHDRIASIDVGGLDFGRSLSAVVFEVGEDGQGSASTRYVIKYPPGDASCQMARITFGGGNFDVRFAYEESDQAILHAQDLFVRASMMIDRLMNPHYLSGRMETMFRSRLKTAVPAAVVEFGRNGHLEGIDDLLELGFLTPGNIEEVIDAATDAGEVAAVSRLVELKRTCFNMPLFDFDV